MKRQQKKIEEERRREEQQRIFLEGLKRFSCRGVRIYICDREVSPEDCSCLFVDDGDYYYMADYVGADTGLLREIRFDRVRNK